MFVSGALHESIRIVTGRAGTVTAAASDYVSLKNHSGITIVVIGANDATAVATTCTIQQATTVAGGSVKLIDGTQLGVNGVQQVDTATSDALSALTISSIGAWTTDDTDSKNFIYIVDISVEALDVAGGFDVVRLLQASGDAVQSVLYLLWNTRYTAVAADQPSSIID